MTGPIVVAIDGPAGSGKSTVGRAGRRAPRPRGPRHRRDVPRGDRRSRCARGSTRATRTRSRSLAEEADLEVGDRVRSHGVDLTDELRTDEVNARGLDRRGAPRRPQRPRRPASAPGSRAHDGGVVEGRDIGSVVFPDARSRCSSPRATRCARAGAGPRSRATPSRGATDLDERPGGVAAAARADDAHVLDTTDRARRRGRRRDPGAAVSEPSVPRPDADARLPGVPRRRARAVVGVLPPDRHGHRARARPRGPFIIAPVHRSNVDFAFAIYVTRAQDVLHGEGLPLAHRSPSGGSSRRWARSPCTAAPRTAARSQAAEAVLRAGEPLVLFPEGTRQEGERDRRRSTRARRSSRRGPAPPSCPSASRAPTARCRRARRSRARVRCTLVIGPQVARARSARPTVAGAAPA